MRVIEQLAPALEQIGTLRQSVGAENVLVVFDLDNTLLTMTSTVGSDAWFTWQDAMRKLKQDPPGRCLVSPDFGELLDAQAMLYTLGRMRPTEPKTANARGVVCAVADLQALGHPVMILTSRGPTVNDVTQRELERNGYDLTRTAPSLTRPIIGKEVLATKPEDLPEGLPKDVGSAVLDGSRPTRYEDGVFMTAGQHKGGMLRLFLARTAERYQHIVFIDDSQKHPEHMRAAFDKHPSTVVHAFHYVNPTILTGERLSESPKRQEATVARWNRLRSLLEAFFGHDVLGASKAPEDPCNTGAAGSPTPALATSAR